MLIAPLSDFVQSSAIGLAFCTCRCVAVLPVVLADVFRRWRCALLLESVLAVRCFIIVVYKTNSSSCECGRPAVFSAHARTRHSRSSRKTM
jgi:hypothetical protein